MAYREVGMVEVREIVRRWLAGDGLRSIARALGVDRKTVAEYVPLAHAAGVERGGWLRKRPPRTKHARRGSETARGIAVS